MSERDDPTTAGTDGHGSDSHGSADPLARIGARLIDAAQAQRRRRRRRQLQRAAGAALTLLLVTAVVAAQPFAGGDAPSQPARERFGRHVAEHGPALLSLLGGRVVCAHRDDDRSPEGNTICGTLPALSEQLGSGAAWVQAQRSGDRVVVSGLAAEGVQVAIHVLAPGGGGPRTTVGPLSDSVRLGADAATAVAVSPFAVELPLAGASEVEIDPRPNGSTSIGGGRSQPQRLEIGAFAPERQPGWRRYSYATATGDGAVAAAESALRRLALPGASVQAMGFGSRLTVDVAGSSPDAVAVRALLAPGRLELLDWEQSVLLADGRTVAAAQAAGSRAAERVSRLAGEGSRVTLLTARGLARGVGDGARVVQALPGGRSAPLARNDPRARFFVLRGEAALTGADVRGAEVGSTSGQPQVTVRFDARGQQRLHDLTRAVSQRGQSLALPGASSAEVAQHIALVLGGRLLSVPSIDPNRLPDGIDGQNGLAIRGGSTAGDADQLALLLQSGPIPRLIELLPRR
ncbi:hypothetical protein Q5424_16955 [Conexibacter sp. JD483]|uniref:SecDF P1 head subdomain-containing protein n=1 Tax=unclassified Conexibacter TaxID=2627773 RepID=UPI00271EA674|nr:MULTISPECIES: hypothetical protein [unclassified Conexibacter]MDO8185521.1 hypothetical protein [Conexibacter sp. CPCC 205706]MDO8197292.1 hypothetical protein [Conexibacter sp. CPCC 205762]MDR9370788.1 hypothetical protein [Conexibacter sp. JD483]